jgi:hypothetical protein
MTPAEIAALVNAAVALSGYAPPEQPPAVVEVTRRWMNERACPHHPATCGIAGLYDDKDVVYYVEGLTWQVGDSTVVHEMVHWLQHHSGRFTLTSCVDRDKREREAYMVQQLYVFKYQHGFLATMVPYALCQVDDSTH